MTRPHPERREAQVPDRCACTTPRDRFSCFLTRRLTEELARIWARDEDRRVRGLRRPGIAAQLGVLDDLLRELAHGHLPDQISLTLLHSAYRSHPDYEPDWAVVAHG